jgi:hypothetical protein
VNRRGDFGEDVHGGKIEDAVNRVQPKAVDVALAHPVECVVDEIASDLVALWPIEVERLTPRRAVTVGEVGPELGQVVSFRPEVVVDDVEDYPEPNAVSAIDEAPQSIRASIGALRRIGICTVVSPVAATGELGDRHQLDCGDAEITQRRQSLDRRVEGARLGEGSDVQFVDH